MPGKIVQRPARARPTVVLVARVTLAVILAGLWGEWPAGAADPTASSAVDLRPFGIRVVDQDTGRGVPLVELRTVNEIRYVTDSAGYVAFREPELMPGRVFFQVRSHGYEFPADGFGFRGTVLDAQPGGSATLKVRRQQLAERLYRITGSGTYADSQLLGHAVPPRSVRRQGQVLGSDSIVCTLHRDRVYWFWGDTQRPDYPLGNFHVPGATTPRPGPGRWSPQTDIPLEYFLGENGRAKETAHLPGDGPTWIGGLASLPDAAGRECLLAAYEKIQPPLTVAARGLAEFDDERREFRVVREIPIDAPLRPQGHPLRRHENGVEYVYFGEPFPWIRVIATREAYLDLAQYEAYTALRSRSASEPAVVERDEQSRPKFAWRRGGRPWSLDGERQLLQADQLKPAEALGRLIDPATGKEVRAHRGSVAWNEFRQRWIAILVEWGGSSSLLGEVWYTESLEPQGPWQRAIKIATHDHYSFYNPKHHPFLDEDGGRRIYFEGTYTRTFSGNADATPRYEYNQILYRLDLEKLPPSAWFSTAANAP
ncbi:MAG: hypothetical protein U0935_12725 [Pirellulales bacterium]